MIQWNRTNQQKKKNKQKEKFKKYIYILTGWCKVRNRKKEKEKRRKIRKTIQKIGKSLWDEKIREKWLGNHEELYITKVCAIEVRRYCDRSQKCSEVS